MVEHLHTGGEKHGYNLLHIISLLIFRLHTRIRTEVLLVNVQMQGPQ